MTCEPTAIAVDLAQMVRRLAPYAADADLDAIRALYRSAVDVLVAAAPAHRQTQIRLAGGTVLALLEAEHPIPQPQASARGAQSTRTKAVVDERQTQISTHKPIGETHE